MSDSNGDSDSLPSSLFFAVLIVVTVLPTFGAGAYAAATPAQSYDVMSLGAEEGEINKSIATIVSYESLSESDQDLIKASLQEQNPRITNASEKLPERVLNATHIRMPGGLYQITYYETMHTVPGIGAYIAPSLVPLIWSSMMVIAVLVALSAVATTIGYGDGGMVLLNTLVLFAFILAISLSSGITPEDSIIATILHVSGIITVLVIVGLSAIYDSLVSATGH